MDTKLRNNEGSMEYINKDKEVFEKNKIEIVFSKYNCLPYKQLDNNFIPNLSILDLLFNEGLNCKKIIKDGFQII